MASTMAHHIARVSKNAATPDDPARAIERPTQCAQETARILTGKDQAEIGPAARNEGRNAHERERPWTRKDAQDRRPCKIVLCGMRRHVPCIAQTAARAKPGSFSVTQGATYKDDGRRDTQRRGRGGRRRADRPDGGRRARGRRLETALIAKTPPPDNRTTALWSASVAAMEALEVWPLCRDGCGAAHRDPPDRRHAAADPRTGGDVRGPRNRARGVRI